MLTSGARLSEKTKRKRKNGEREVGRREREERRMGRGWASFGSLGRGGPFLIFFVPLLLFSFLEFQITFEL